MASAAMLSLSACNDLNEQEYEGNNYLSADQRLATNEVIPDRVKATYDGMFNYIGKGGTSGQSKGQRADDFGLVMALISGDLEGADVACGDNNYNWFSVCGDLSSRNANYANPYIRYVIPYKQMGVANQVISSYPADTQDKKAITFIASAKTIRAYDYMMLAPYFQFGYEKAADQPCVPLLSDSVDATHNPRATVKKVYEVIMNDLNYAVENLGAERSNKQYINVDVALGLRARANLAMGKWADAAADAEKVINSGRYTPATREEVSVPGFDDATSGDGHAWICAPRPTRKTTPAMATTKALRLGTAPSLATAMPQPQATPLSSTSCSTTRFPLPTCARDGGSTPRSILPTGLTSHGLTLTTVKWPKVTRWQTSFCRTVTRLLSSLTPTSSSA